MTESFIIGSVLVFNTESAIIAKANRTVYPKEISEIKFTDNPKVKNWFTNYNTDLLDKIRLLKESI